MVPRNPELHARSRENRNWWGFLETGIGGALNLHANRNRCRVIRVTCASFTPPCLVRKNFFEREYIFFSSPSLDFHNFMSFC